jgi:hypothetical protein
MAIPIKIPALAMGALLVAGCTASQPDGLDPKNDLHCAIALWLTGQYAERTNAPVEKRRALFVGNSWFSYRIPAERLDTPEARDILAKAKQHPKAVEPAALACIDRATRQTGFAGFRNRIGKVYDQADAERER